MDKDRKCGGNPGWPKSWCNDKNVFGGMMYATVNAKCPKMCGRCGKLLVTVRAIQAKQNSHRERGRGLRSVGCHIKDYDDDDDDDPQICSAPKI